MKELKKPTTVFDIQPGMRLYDTFNNRYGRVTDVRETKPEWIEPFVKWDDAEEEETFSIYQHNIKFVGE